MTFLMPAPSGKDGLCVDAEALGFASLSVIFADSRKSFRTEHMWLRLRTPSHTAVISFSGALPKPPVPVARMTRRKTCASVPDKASIFFCASRTWGRLCYTTADHVITYLTRLEFITVT